mgnify:CR=1 FL=1
MARVNSLKKVKKAFEKVIEHRGNTMKRIARFANAAFYYAKGDLKANKMPCYFLVMAFGGKMKDDMNAHYFPSPKSYNNFFVKYGSLFDELTDINSSTLCHKRKKQSIGVKCQLCYVCPLHNRVRKLDACHVLHDMVVDYNSYKNDVLKTPSLNPDEERHLISLVSQFGHSVEERKWKLGQYLISVLDYVKAKIQKEVEE